MLDDLNKNINDGISNFNKLDVHKRYIYIISVIVVIFIFLLIFQECKNQSSADKIVNELSQYKTQASHYEDKFGNIIASNSAIQVESQKQLKSILATNDTMRAWIKKFKDVKFGGIIKETFTIREVPVPFETKIPCDFKPFPAIKLDKNYRFYSTIANTGLTIDSLFIPNTEDIIVGEKKSGFLNLKRVLTMEVKNSNSLISVSDISGFTYSPKKRRFGLGFSVGYGVGLKQGIISTQPFIGASLNYNLISF